MYPDNQQPSPNTQPTPQQPVTPPAEPQAPAAPAFQPFAPIEPQPSTNQPQPVAPTPPAAPVAPTQFPAEAPVATPVSNNKFMNLLNEKAGWLSLAAFGIAFVILSTATVIEINNALNTLSTAAAQFGGNIKLPSLFELTRDSITHWVFVNVISMAWWMIGLLPAVALAAYSFFKQGFRNIPAIVTVALSAGIIINTIVK